MANPRVVAAHILYDVVIKHKHLKTALSDAQSRYNNPQDQAWVQSLCYHSLRHFHNLQARWQKYTAKKLKDELVALLLTSALAQKFYLHTPDHAIVNESIKALKKLKKNWATGLANKVLRLALADENFSSTNEEIIYSHPQWLINHFKKDWPDDYKKILTANNQQAPLWIRATDKALNIDGVKHPYIQTAIKIEPCDIRKHPEFKKGHISVQDASAQLAAELLELKPTQRVLDVCAAPGGKACHMIQKQSIELTAIELYASRMQQIENNLERINAQAQLIQADATKPGTWPRELLDAKPFDHILADVPCSATGVMRRHPDIKTHRTAEQMDQILLAQSGILSAMTNLLTEGGYLLYATCSVLAQENWQQIATFLQQNPEFREIPISRPFARNCLHGIQIITGTEDMDGFYYCLLRKNK